ncbi:hypothetical protein P4110_29485 [Pseudomonas aeruginosa]|nr:hypothetical protein [Pseudomonas aeruginosa]
MAITRRDILMALCDCGVTVPAVTCFHRLPYKRETTIPARENRHAPFIAGSAGPDPGLAMNATLADEPTPPANCINTEVNGYQALSYECLSQQMTDPDSAARARREQELDSAAIVRRPPNQLGLYNQSATRIRLGTSFGNSVEAQRPPR